MTFISWPLVKINVYKLPQLLLVCFERTYVKFKQKYFPYSHLEFHENDTVYNNSAKTDIQLRKIKSLSCVKKYYHKSFSQVNHCLFKYLNQFLAGEKKTFIKFQLFKYKYFYHLRIASFTPIQMSYFKCLFLLDELGYKFLTSIFFILISTALCCIYSDCHSADITNILA